MISARIERSPPASVQAAAMQSAASAAFGSAAVLKSGHGRRNRPDIAVIFPASQRLIVSVTMKPITPEAGMIVTSASSNLSSAAMPRISKHPLRALFQGVENCRGVGAEHQQRAKGGQRCKACDPDQDAADRIPFDVRRFRAIAGRGDGPAEQGEMSEPPGRQRHADDVTDAAGNAEDRGERKRSGRARRWLQTGGPNRARSPSAAVARD